MTLTTAEPAPPKATRAVVLDRVSRDDPRVRAAGYAILALLAYVPPLLTQPGKVAADTKQYLYLDPGRLLSRAAYMWDPNIGFGTVTHQNIGYLFPMGPYYWVMDRVGVPDWVAQRLWLGTLVFSAGLGVLYLMRRLGRVGPGVVVTTLAFMFTPYVLDYSARISVLLMPWAALGFLIGFVIDATRDGGWAKPALFALVVQVIGGVNATALVYALLAPIVWLAYTTLVTRQTRLRRALAVAGRVGVLTLVTSLWWIAGLSIQGQYGLDILKYTETVKAVSRTSLPGEVLRGLGYWFFYGQDRIGPWTEAAASYTQHVHTILVGYGLAALALLAAAMLRWRQRGFFLLLALIGTVLGVGVYPYDHPSPLGALFKAFQSSSKAGLALRSTGRVTPLVVLGLAALLGAGVDAVVRRLRRRPTRWSTYAAWATPVVVGALVLANFPALWNGTYYGKNLERPENIPQYWYQAAAAIDAGGTSTRVLELPGADFASYQWGNLVDPVTPGITDRPYVARELIPWGSPAGQNLLDAFDRRYQENVDDPRGVADLLRLMSAGAVVLRYDIQHERYNLIRPKELQRAFAATPGLSAPQAFGPPAPTSTYFPEVDERTLGAPANEPDPPSVALYQVPDARPIARAESAASPLVVAGDGEGLVDASDVGLLRGNRTVLYAGSYDAADLRRLGGDGVLVLTDSNRKRAEHWSTVLDVYGFTEQANQLHIADDPGDARLDVFPDAGTDAYTVTDQQGVDTVVASAYGNPISYTPEDRAARAFDGDFRTAWKTQAFDEAIGQKLRADLQHPITTDHVGLVQVLEGPRDRYITQVKLRLDGHVVGTYALDASSRTKAGQTVTFGRHTFHSIEIEVTDTNRGHGDLLHGGESAVGFTEVDLRDGSGAPVRVHEVEDMPTDLLSAFGASSQSHPLVVIMSRDRQLPVPPRYDPELVLSRSFSLPTARTFALTGTARLTSDVLSQRLDAVFGVPDAAHGGVTSVAKDYLAGCIRCRAPEAIDGDPTTAWNTPEGDVVGQWVDYTTAAPVTFDAMNLQIVADGRHSLPKTLELDVDGQQRIVSVPRVADHPGDDNATSAVRVTFPRVTGSHVRITIRDLYPHFTTNYFNSHPFYEPIGIADWGIQGLALPSAPATLPSVCRTDLLTIDGKPLPIRIAGAHSDAEWLQPLDIELCDPAHPGTTPALALGAGAHVLESAPGRATGINLDRLVLASDAGGGAHGVRDGQVATFAPPPGAASPKVTVTANGRTSLTLHVSGATRGRPFWLVLGESQNKGWTASIAGAPGAGSLGGSTLVDGYANGWYVTPTAASFTVRLDWTPQRRVWIAIALSILGVLLCVALVGVAWARSRRRAPGGAVAIEHPALLVDGGVRSRPASWPAVAAIALGTAVVVWLVSTPVVGLAAGIVVALVLARPRLRVAAALVGPFVLGVVALYIGYKQYKYEFPAVFEWPTLFPRAFQPAWFAVLVVAALVATDLVRRRGRDPAGDAGETTGAPHDRGASDRGP